MVGSRTSIARSLRAWSRAELRARIVDGYPVDPTSLEGWAYRGTSLGLPSAVERLSWKTFQKTFWREPGTGRLVGWNVRLEQDGVDAPSRPVMRHGRPVTQWHYEVVEPALVPTPPGFDRGLVIDYSQGPNGWLEPVRLGKDPLVSLSPDHADELIGVTYLVIAGRCVETPTYFVLERDHPIDYVPAERLAVAAAAPTDVPRSVSPLRLRGFERAWAEALFEALLPGHEAAGLPPFRSVDRARFWQCLERAPGPSFGAGLRAMVYALTLLPVADPRLRRPFFRLERAEREAAMARYACDDRFAVRQMVVTMKTLACLAYFDDPAVRLRVGADPPGASASPDDAARSDSTPRPSSEPGS